MWWIFLFIIILLCAILVYLGYHFTKVATHPITRTYENAIERELGFGNFDLDTFNRLEKEDILIKSSRGYDLRGYYIPSPGSKKVMIFAHGITYNLFGSVKYMMPFIHWGYNVLIYDHRNHGKSGGDSTTFGYYEKMDLKEIVDYVICRVGDDAVIGTHGESMGAATVLQHAGIDPRVAFVIADCPFVTAWDEFAYRLKVEHHLPPFPILHMASLICYFKTGAFFSKMSPLDAVKNIKSPVLWFHGDADDYIPVEHSKRLYDAKKEAKKIVIVAGAKHAKSYQTAPEEYKAQLASFLRQFNI